MRKTDVSGKAVCDTLPELVSPSRMVGYSISHDQNSKSQEPNS
jgi:hypothetical protein